MDVAVFECKNCGGNLEFKPGQSSLECPYCGTRNEIGVEAPVEVQEELDYQSAIANLNASSETTQIRETTCGGCGASVTFEENATTGECPYCGTHVVATAGAHTALIPQYILPFCLSERSKAPPLYSTWTRLYQWVLSCKYNMNKYHGTN